MEKYKNILFTAQRPSDFVEMERAAKFFSQKQDKCFMLYVCNNPDLEIKCKIGKLISEKIIVNGYFLCPGQTAEIKKQNKKLLHLTSEKIEKKALKRFIFRFKKNIYSIVYLICPPLIINILRKVKRLLSFGIISVLTQLYIVNFYFKYYAIYQKILKRYQVDLIVLPEDVVGLVTPLMIRAGHKYKIPSMILPYTIANQNEAFQSLKSVHSYNMNLWPNKIVGFMFRRWVMRQEGISLLRLPAPYVWGHFLTRTNPPDPWMMNSGYANVIAVESQSMFNYYLDAGISKQKMKLVGAFYDDQLLSYMQQDKKKELYQSLGLTMDKPILLLAGCPNQLLGTVPQFDFKDFKTMVIFIVKTFEPIKNRYHFVMRPHPNYPDLADLFKQYNFMITDLPTDQLIAISDIYVAFASATIRWAIMCGVPTINYDVFYYKYSDYNKASGVINVNTKDEFKSAVKQISDTEIYLDLKNKINFIRKNWGMLDGKSAERIFHLAEELCSLNKTRHKKKKPELTSERCYEES